MKFICLKENIKEALSYTERVIDRNTTLPILEHFLLKAEKGQFTITGTNLEIGIQSKISGKVEEDGVLTVAARTFSQFISLSPQEKIVLEGHERHLSVKDEKTSSTFKSLDPEEYPLFPQFTEEGVLRVKNRDLIDAIGKISIALSGGELRPELTGAFFLLKEKSLICAATDSFRLAEKKIIQDYPLPDASFIVPSRTIQEVTKIASTKPEEEVEIKFNKNQITFYFSATILTSRLLVNTFPDYAQIIPQTHSTELLLSKKELTQSLQLASVIAGKTKEVHLLFSGGSSLILKTKNAEVGEYESFLEVKKSKGDPVTLTFNAGYLLDAMGVLPGNDIQVFFHGEAKPGMLTSPQDPNYLYIVMPLRN